MSTTPTIGEQLKQTLSDRGVTATELGRLSGVRTSFIYDVLSGKSKNPSIITLSKIANALAIPLAELSGGGQQTVGDSSSKLPQGYITIPTLNINAATGSESATNNDEVTNIEHYVFHRSWIRNSLGSQPETLRLHGITGDSMEPTLGHGDVVLVDTHNTAPSTPGIFVLYDGVGLVVKRVEVLPESSPQALLITSDNAQYDPYQRELDKIQIVGRVVWIAREL